MKKIIKILLFLITFVLLIWLVMLSINFSNRDMITGVTFSSDYARFLNIDPQKTMDRILNEWNFKYIRLIAQWDNIEKIQGEYDFSDLDWQIKKAEERGAKVMLAVGQKTPRWPECHIPGWSAKLSQQDYQTALFNFITAIVNRYKNSSALEIWQVENEPYVSFGTCPPLNEETLDKEIVLVKTLDKNHPTITTDSGELSLWFHASHKADLFGSTMYRVVWDKNLGYVHYNLITASYYWLRARLNGLPMSKVYITELQAEPWSPNGNFFDLNLEEQYKSMNIAQLEKNLAMARHTGFSRTYLWGAEWWVWLEGQGDNEMVNYIKELKK